MKPLIGAGGPASAGAEAEVSLTARLPELAPALDGEPDPEWRSRTRGRLVAMAAVRTPGPAPVSAPPRVAARPGDRRGTRRARLVAGLVGAAAAVTAVAAVVALSADARPGDVLYGLKRGAEQTELAVAGDARGSTLLGFASTRLEELSAVAPDGASPDVVERILTTMDDQTADGAAWLGRQAVETGTSRPLEELSGWSERQAAGLADLRSELPTAAEDDAANAADLLARIDARAAALLVALSCPTGPATDGIDALGPVPGACGTAPPPPAAVGGEPGGAVTDRPGATGAPAPTSPAGGPGGVAGSGESGSGSGSEPGGRGLPGLPPPATATPGVPGLPLPSLPTLFPGPDGQIRPPAAGSAPNPGGPSASTTPSPGAGVCLPPLPVVGDC